MLSPQDKGGNATISKNQNFIEAKAKSNKLNFHENRNPSRQSSLAISKEILLSSKICKIADFFDMDVQELIRYLSVHSPTPFSRVHGYFLQSLDQPRKQAVTDFAKKELENQTTEERLKMIIFKVYESCTDFFLNKPEQADIVWSDKELDYDIALWIRTDSLGTQVSKGSVAHQEYTF